MIKVKENLSILKVAFLLVVFCNVAVDISHKILLQNIAFKIFDGSEQVIWISIINLLIILPFLLLFTLSGYLSDKYPKKNILIYGAISSFSLSIFMVVAYFFGNFYFAMLGLFFLAIQSTIYSPAKFGIIIDIYGKSELSRGNSSLQAVSIISILVAMAMFSYFFESFYVANNLEILQTKEQLMQSILPLTFYIVPISFVEMVISLLVLKAIKTENKGDRSLSLDKKSLLGGKLFKQNISKITSNRIIYLSVLGLGLFWGVSQGMVAVFPAFAKMYLDITNVFVINGVIAASGIGIAIGAYFYAKYSKHYIEVGTIPFAALGMSLMIFLATLVEDASYLALTFLGFGIFGGLFVVPLNALIQFNSKKKFLGTVLAGNNWFQSLFMCAVLIGTTTVSLFELDPLNTIYIILLLMLSGAIYITYSIPQSMIIFFLKWVVGLKYKLEVNGVKNIPSSRGALLLGNHMSWLDWAVIYMATPRQIKFVMDKHIYSRWYLNWLMKFFKIIPISSSSRNTLQTIANELDNGSVIVLFPEGNITRNGHLGEFKKGFEKILELTKTDIPVIAFYIRGLWESRFSRANKKYKKSKRTGFVTISFSKPIKKSKANAVRVKNEIINLTTKSWKKHINKMGTIPETIIDRLKEVKKESIFADTTGLELSGYRFLTVSILFKDLLAKQIQGQNVGLLIPASVGGAFINTSVLMLGKTCVNLNFTASIESLIKSVEKAEIKSIVTSKKFIEKLKEKGIAIDEVLALCDVIYTEDLKAQISKPKGLITLLSVIALPAFILKLLHVKKVHRTSTALIMFSSGSEGVPKGIKLSHKNVLGNSQQIAAVLNVNEYDTIVGSLPLFHAFGVVVTNFLPLIEGIKCVSHPDPTDGQAIGKLVQKYKATIMLGTSTFFRLYAKNAKVQKENFASLRLVVAGAEKLSTKVREEFFKKFDKQILEGYGTTETTPVAACNLPDVTGKSGAFQRGTKFGTVGMAIPGTRIKIVDPNTYKELGVNEEGMILICGVQVMKGYLKDKEKTKKALIKLKGKTYYITGDKGKLDEDGFLTIVDRYSRFAKLGGEMISLGAIEQNIEKLITKDDCEFMITSISDDKKGEKIVLLITNIEDEGLLQLKQQIKENFDSNLMIPALYKVVDEILKLGTGKKDFAKAKIVANS